jgi:hypothetical protein
VPFNLDLRSYRNHTGSVPAPFDALNGPRLVGEEGSHPLGLFKPEDFLRRSDGAINGQLTFDRPPRIGEPIAGRIRLVASQEVSAQKAYLQIVGMRVDETDRTEQEHDSSGTATYTERWVDVSGQILYQNAVQEPAIPTSLKPGEVWESSFELPPAPGPQAGHSGEFIVAWAIEIRWDEGDAAGHFLAFELPLASYPTRTGVAAPLALAARMLSAGGAVACAFGGIFDTRYSYIRNIGVSRWPTRWPITQALAAVFLVGFGVVFTQKTMLSQSNPPVAVTLDQISQNSYGTDQPWVTVSGRLQPASLDAQNGGSQYDRIYLLTSEDGRLGLLVESTEAFGTDGGDVTITGALKGSTAYGTRLTMWMSWATSTYPSPKVIDTLVLNTSDTPLAPGFLLFSIPLIILGAWLLAGTWVGYVVFIGSIPDAAPVLIGPPARSAVVHVSGLVARARGGWAGVEIKHFRLREARGTIRSPEPDEGRSAAGSFVIAIEGFASTVVDTHPARPPEPGHVFPVRGPRPAIRLYCGGHTVVLSFDDAATRDSWLPILERHSAR